MASLASSRDTYIVQPDDLPEEILRKFYDENYRPGERLEDLVLVFTEQDDCLWTRFRWTRGQYVFDAWLTSVGPSQFPRGWVATYEVECDWA